MTDRIAYVSVDTGDGSDRESIVHATWTQRELSMKVAADKNKAYQRQDKRIVGVEDTRKAAMKKLNALDRLVLGLHPNGDKIQTTRDREVLMRPAGICPD